MANLETEVWMMRRTLLLDAGFLHSRVNGGIGRTKHGCRHSPHLSQPKGSLVVNTGARKQTRLPVYTGQQKDGKWQ